MKWLFFSYCVLCLNILIGQSSFFKVLEYSDEEENTVIANGLTINDNGEISYLLSDGDGVFKFVRLSSEGDILSASKGDLINTLSSGFWRLENPTVKGKWHALLATFSGVDHQGAMFVVNEEDSIAWGKKIASHYIARNSVLLADNEKVLCTTFPIEPQDNPQFRSGVAQFELETGNQEWSAFYEKQGEENRSTKFKNITEIQSGEFSVLAEVNLQTEYGDENLLKIDAEGNLLKSVDIITDSLDFFLQGVDAQLNIYLAGRKVGPTGSLSTDSDGLIIKLDSEYNLIWGKKMIAEQFNCSGLTFNIFPNGDLIFAYTTSSRLPVITGKVSSNGELLWHKGFAFTGAKMAVAQDSSVYLSSLYLYQEDGRSDRAKVVAKTNPKGEIEGCPQFDACLRLEDFEIELQEWPWTQGNAPFSSSIDVNIEPMEFTAYSTCGVPDHPVPDFHLPDTICQFTCLSPDSLKNDLANHVEWTIIGPDLDTLIVSENFEWCFDSEGVYTVEQEIWLLGCSDFFSKTITVLDTGLVLSLGEDQYICEDMAYLIEPTASRSLRNFLWDNGQETSTISVIQPGDYSLTATDGFCRDSAVINLTLINDFLSEDPLFTIRDTILCPDLLPYVLRPQSPYSSSFYMDDETMMDTVFHLTKQGIYTVHVAVENCIFSEVFELKMEECQAPIYIANAFSPNNDGVNDLIFPQGQDFEGVQLSVFNRWGDLVFKTNQAPFAWNGDFVGNKLDSAVYLLTFTYFNQRNLKNEMISKDVLLVR